MKNNGSVVTWGDASRAGDSATLSSSLSSGVVVLYTDNQNSYAALKNDGSVIVITNVAYGGDPHVAASSVNLTSTVSVYNYSRSYAALKQNGGVVTWGLYFYGGYSGSVTNDISAGIVKLFGGS